MGWLNYLILGLYICGMVAIAIYSRNKSKSVKDFLFAGKKGLNGWMSAFAYGTTYFSAVIFVGYAGKFGWSFGLSAVWIGVGNAIIGSYIAWSVLARRTKNMTQRLQAKTMPEFFGKRFESKNLKLVSALIIFIFLIPYGASVYNGLGYIFEAVFGIPSWGIILILACVTAVYLFFGGYFATSLTDFIQGIIMLVGVVIMVFFFLDAPEVNCSEGINKLMENGFGWVPNGTDGVNFLYDKPMTLISLVLLTSLGVWGLPQTVHKYYAIRDNTAIKQGKIVSTAFALIIGFGAYFVGSFATLFFTAGLPTGGTDMVIPIMLQKVIPAGLLGVIAVLLLSASMSTLASVSLSASSVMTVDVYNGFIKKDATDKQSTITMRIMCLVFIAISVILAILNNMFQLSAIAYLMALSWGTLSGCFIGPFVLGIVSKKTTKTASWVSIIGSLVLTVALIIIFGFDSQGWGGVSFGQAIKGGMAYSPLVGVICMVYSLIATFIVSLFTKKASNEALFEAFEKPIDNEILSNKQEKALKIQSLHNNNENN